jgi:hypothetical protein
LHILEAVTPNPRSAASIAGHRKNASIYLAARHRRAARSAGNGKKAMTPRGATVAADFKHIVIDYIERRYGTGGGRTTAE